MADPSNYAETIRARLPPAYSAYFIDALVSAVGSLIDSIPEAVTQAALNSFVAGNTIDGLSRSGWERRIRRANSESNESYRLRLVSAWSAWGSAGTKEGILSQLRAVGYDGVIYEGRDTPGLQWHQFKVVIHKYPAGLIQAPALYGDGSTFGQNGLVYGSINPGLASILRSVINTWKPVYAECVEIQVLVNAKLYGSGQPFNSLYGDGSKWGNGGIVTIPTTGPEDNDS